MPMFGLFRMFFGGLLAVALWVAAGVLFYKWSQNLPDPRPAAGEGVEPTRPEPAFGERFSAWRPGADRATAYLATGLLLSLIGIGGGRAFCWLVLPKGKDRPEHERGGDVHRIARPDGSQIHIEVFGRSDAPTLVLTHGWGASLTEWYYLRRQLGDRYRLVTWDLPGLGRSKGPDDCNYRLEKLAADLKAVVDAHGNGPVVLLGHSIGGMIGQQYAKQFQEELGEKVAGIVLVHTTHTNPLTTTEFSGLYTALQKPIIEPMAHAFKVLSPAIWLMNAMSYLNGTLHASNYRSLFSWNGTWGKLEFVTKYVLQIWPANYARGMLGMLRFHATDALPTIDVPTLVVAADKDKITKPSASVEIRSRVPGADMATLPACGHMGLIQRHEEFHNVIEQFLARCFAGRESGAAVLAGARH